MPATVADEQIEDQPFFLREVSTGPAEADPDELARTGYYRGCHLVLNANFPVEFAIKSQIVQLSLGKEVGNLNTFTVTSADVIINERMFLEMAH
jgi:hypothetical protein